MTKAFEPSDRLTRRLALGGIVGPVLMVSSFVIAGRLRPGYSPIHQVVSDLGLGPHAWLVNGAGLANAVLLTAWVVAFLRATRGVLGPGWRWVAAVLLELPPIGYLVASIFTEAPPTLEIHSWVGANLALASPALAFFAAALALRRHAPWRGWSLYSFLASLVTALLVVLTLEAFGVGGRLPVGHVEGFMERALIIETLAWYVVGGWRIAREARELRP